MIRRVILLFAVSFFLFAACKSSEKVADSGDMEGSSVVQLGGGVEEGSEEPKPLSKEELAELKKKEKEAKKAKKADEKRRKREVTDKYLGVVYTPEKTYDLRSGKVHVALRGSTGSFNIYAIDSKNKETPILSTADDSSTSYFSILIGKREYRLNKTASINAQVRQKDDGGQIAYLLDKQLQIVLDFSTAASVVGEDDDIVKISVYVTNLTQNRQVLAIKAVLDTILGENLDYHFVTATGQKIETETQLLLFREDRYFLSTNEKTTAQFLLNGKTIWSPECVSFANRDALVHGLWVPVITESKSFSSVLAYNNSGVCINWPYFIVEADDTYSFSFYIALATDKEQPKGLSFVDTLADDSQRMQSVDGSKTGITVKKPDVDFIVAPITDDKLDPADIQNLIDRINSLSSDPALVDRTELRQLNAELDAIMERIRQLNQR